MDVFYEESALAHNSEKKKKKYNIISAVSVVFLVLGILWIIIGFYTIDITSLGSWLSWGLICAWLFLAWFLLRRWKMNVNVSFDYCFVSGELRISKVMNVNKRKLVARVDCEDMIQFGDVDNPSFDRFRSDPATKTVLCTSNDVAADGKFFMYVLAEYNGKKLFVLECREELLMNILKFAKRNKLESDYVMQEKKQKQA
ncbi:MAG: hypothetical protein IJ284_00305 [Clostridia bacterium]|nr:hypothetical protein [Clostridia bacterium]